MQHSPEFQVRLAQSKADVRAAQRLRYDVFIDELSGDGPLVDHDARLECDAFDPFFDHLLLLDQARGGQVVGVYRLMPSTRLQTAGRFYSEDEYDLGSLKASGRRLLELGRSCLHKDYRGGAAMLHLWNGLADYVLDHEIEVLFGVASFHGTDIAALAQPLSYLHHYHRAPDALAVQSHPEHFQTMNLLPKDQIKRRDAMMQTPALIKAYLRLGGCVGTGAFVDHAFNTTDVCLIMETEKMNAKHRAIYEKKGAL